MIYLTLDNADGKQARKTGNSSTLGMILDHGCDCLVTGVIVVIACHIMQISTPLASIMVFLGGFVFFAKIMEQLATKKMTLGVINPVDEGLPAISLLLIVFGIIGNSVWTKESVVWSFSWRELCIYSLAIVTFFFTFASLYEVLKIKSFLWVFKCLFMFIFVLGGCAGLLLIDFAPAFAEPKYLFLFFIVLQARICTGIMMSHVQDTEPHFVLFYPMFLASVMYVICGVAINIPSTVETLSIVYKVTCAAAVVCKLTRLHHVHHLFVQLLGRFDRNSDLFRKRNQRRESRAGARPEAGNDAARDPSPRSREPSLSSQRPTFKPNQIYFSNLTENSSD